MTKHYAEVKAKADFVELEKEVLKFWEEDKTFEKSVRNRDGAAEFVFYDGPPFAALRAYHGFLCQRCRCPLSDHERQKG